MRALSPQQKTLIVTYAPMCMMLSSIDGCASDLSLQSARRLPPETVAA